MFKYYNFFYFKKRIDPAGFIINVGSGHVLDVEGGAMPGRRIIQYTPHGGENQRWRFNSVGVIVYDALQ